MRLAQRRYRSKKQDTLAAAEQKATALEAALRGTISAFRDLQKTLLQHSPGVVPLDVAIAVSKTSFDISTLLQSSGIQVQDTLACNLLGCGGHNCARTVFAERLVRSPAGFMHHEPTPLTPVSPLNSGSSTSGGGMPDMPLECFRPELLGGMSVLPGELLIAQTIGQASPHALLAEQDYVGRFLPQLHRKIEGRLESVVRMAPPRLQCLKYGCTRTSFETDVPELAGEWLESADVEEYLAQRGIHVRDKSTKVATLHLGSEGSGGGGAGSDADSSDGSPSTQAWETELPDWTIFGKQLDYRQQIPSGTRVVTQASLSASIMNWMGDTPTTHSPWVVPQAKITINVDRLIHGLSARVFCLGPAPGIRRYHVDQAIHEAVQLV